MPRGARITDVRCGMAFVIVGYTKAHNLCRVLWEFAGKDEADRLAALFREHLEDYSLIDVEHKSGPAERVQERDIAIRPWRLRP